MSVNVYDPINDKLIPVAGATLYAASPVGSIIAFAGKEINLPEGYLAFNGQTVKRGDYPDLWAFAVANEQVGVDKFFSQGDGSTTFTLADLRETSLKGYGETSRSVGNHVKSGGLAVGEFIDDRLQNHDHGIPIDQSSGSSLSTHVLQANANIETTYTGPVHAARRGTTTEVKAVGVVWAVKARQTGLPIDLKQQVENKLKWKLINRVNTAGGYDTTFTLPSEYEELLVVCGTPYYQFSDLIPKSIIEANGHFTGFHETGFTGSSMLQQYSYTLSSIGRFTTTSVKHNGSDNTGFVAIYYR